MILEESLLCSSPNRRQEHLRRGFTEQLIYIRRERRIESWLKQMGKSFLRLAMGADNSAESLNRNIHNFLSLENLIRGNKSVEEENILGK